MNQLVSASRRNPRVSGVLTHPDVEACDLPALRDLVRFGVMVDDQLARRYLDPTVTPARLLHLKEAGIVNRWWESLEGARVYSPTRLARVIAAVPGMRPRTTYASHLAHDVALVDLADFLVAQNTNHRWIAEDEVRGFLDQIAPPPRRLNGDTRHRPDGLLVTGDARIAIELEHSDKYPTRYARISAWFVREWRVDRVRWYIDKPGILRHLREVNERHGFDREMRIELEPFPPTVRVRQRRGRYEP
ncbi:MAG: hypothetical protein JO352_00830 [Chloroflexi bacterium]|nr:hypothetical protein [Chloroflexota bacterium]